MNKKDTLGDRVKRYESVNGVCLMRRTPVIIRVDGKAFHTYTRGMSKPFDQILVNAMVSAGIATAKSMSGFRLGYHQSDEFTFLLMDTDTYETEAWFDNKLQKLVSITASTFTAHFNEEMAATSNKKSLAMFDARAFNVPLEEAPNVFIWRQRDWARNSLQMLCRSHFSHKQLHNKKTSDMHEMLHEIGVNWADLEGRDKNGTFITRTGETLTEKMEYDRLMQLVLATSEE